MFIGQTLVAENYPDPDSPGSAVAHPSVVYTPWMPRGGNSGTFAMEVLALSWQDGSGAGASLPQLTMSVQTKNSESDDSSLPSLGSVTVTNATAGSLGVATVAVTNCLELVRCKFELTDTASSPAERVYYAVFRCLNVSWAIN